jgi:hypothetical protein
MDVYGRKIFIGYDVHTGSEVRIGLEDHREGELLATMAGLRRNREGDQSSVGAVVVLADVQFLTEPDRIRIGAVKT